MQAESEVLAAEQRFFAALMAGDRDALNQILTDDFLLIDVMRGAEVPKSALLAVVEADQIRFDEIEPAEARVRFYASVAVVTGSTQMQGRFGEVPFGVHSRYTHVFVEQQGQWRLASAQGTPISD